LLCGVIIARATTNLPDCATVHNYSTVDLEHLTTANVKHYSQLTQRH